MSKNSLTPAQDVITRDFYQDVLCDPSLLVDNPVARRNAIRLCLTLLGYIVVDGKHVDPDKLGGYKLGGTIECVDEWEDDTRRAHDALSKTKDTSEADSSVEAEDTEVREAVLPEDV